MGQPSFAASNALIYVTYGLFLYELYAALSNSTLSIAAISHHF